MITFKKILAVLLCAALMLGTVSAGLTVFADEQPIASGEAAGPADGAAEDGEEQAEESLSDKVEKIEFDKKFISSVYFLTLEPLTEGAPFEGLFPEYIKITFTDGSVAEVSQPEAENQFLSEVKKEFSRSEDGQHGLIEYYSTDENGRVVFVIELDGKTIYCEEPDLVFTLVLGGILSYCEYFLEIFDFSILARLIVDLSRGNFAAAASAISEITEFVKGAAKCIQEYLNWANNNHYSAIFIPEAYIKYINELININIIEKI